MSRRVVDISVRASGFLLLGIGIVLLLLTFTTAYGFLRGVLEIQLSGDIMHVFGEAMAPLVETSVKAIFLGIMGWIGSILTNRGVQILTSPHKESGSEEEKKNANKKEKTEEPTEKPVEEKEKEEEAKIEKDGVEKES
ncbi:MAG: hypothetical protein ACLFVP_05470 [Candidatus Bathyarchaeia archaeon]